MHIPDGFLSTPVWATFDILSVPAVGILARRAQRDSDDSRIPLLGVLGGFVFAAQMINFPVGLGTSGHLIGGTLLAIALGPSSAVIVMTAIIAMQAFFFQDGGILALGANIFNMAIVGVFAGYLPYRILSNSSRSAAIFIGATLSVLLSAALALSELMISGVPMQRHVLLVSLAWFLASAVIEGAITLAAVRAIERIRPAWMRAPERRESHAVLILAILVTLVIAAAFASTNPDGIQRVLATQMSADVSWARRALVGFAGIVVTYLVCLAVGKGIALARKRSA
jgi:cobalt/nickel transport system permease protein